MLPARRFDPDLIRCRARVADRARASAAEARSQHRLDTPQNIDLTVTAVSSGASVNTRSASTVPVFAACVGLYSDMVAKLPLDLFQRTDAGAEKRRDLPAFQCFFSSAAWTRFELFRSAESGVGYGGNGYVRVYRDSNYDPVELEVLAPCDVRVEKVRDKSGRPGVLYYVGNNTAPLTRADIIHVRGQTRPGDVVGMSPVTQLRESLGLAITQREKAGKVAKNGESFPGILSSTAQRTPDQIKAARAEWNRSRAEGGEGSVAIIDGTWSFAAANGMTMQDAEFLESRIFERTEICTLHRVPEVLLGNSEKASSWGTGIETLTNGFLTLALDPHLIAWEQAMNLTLLTQAQQAEGFYFKFNRDAALSMLPEAKAKFLREMRDIRVMNVNDCRGKLDMNLLSAEQGGDDYAAGFNGTGGIPAKSVLAPAVSAP